MKKGASFPSVSTISAWIALDARNRRGFSNLVHFAKVTTSTLNDQMTRSVGYITVNSQELIGLKGGTLLKSFNTRLKIYQSSLAYSGSILNNRPKHSTSPDVIKLFSCSTQLSMKLFLLINLKLLTIANSFLLNIAEHENFSANKYENANYCSHFHIY